MRHILKLAGVFLKQSRFLTLSCILSIFFADFLCVSMFQLSANAKQKYEDSILEEYGDFQVRISTEDGRYFTAQEMEQIKEQTGITGCTDGFYCEIEGEQEIYALGVKDDGINQSQYKYSYPVEGNTVVINEYLARQYQIGEGDTFEIQGKTFQVGELIRNDSFTETMTCMMLMERDALHEFLGDEKGQCNYMLIQCEDKTISELSSRLQDLSKDFSVYVVKEDETVRRLLLIFQVMIRMLSGIVVLISGMFIVSNFHEYLRKYRRDMAVMRTVGGTEKQISLLFGGMSLFLSMIGCGLGMLCTVLVDKYLLSILNDKLNLFQGGVVIQWGNLFGFSGVIFVLFNLIVLVFFIYGQSVMPIQVFNETDSHVTGRRKFRMTWLRKLFGNQGYLAVKLMLPKLAQNFFIILIIALITMFSYVGLSFLELLQGNSTSYLKSITHEADYMVHWETEENQITIEKIKQYAERINAVDGVNSYYQMRVQGDWESTSDIYYVMYATNLDAYFRVHEKFYKKKIKKDSFDDYILMTPDTMKNVGYREGDEIVVTPPMTKEKKTYTVLEAANNIFGGLDEDNQIYIDVENVDMEEAEKNDIQDTFFYIWGDGNTVENVLGSIAEENSDVSWIGYKERRELESQIFNQRMALIKLVLGVLSFVAGIGWLNSTRGILLSRREEFHTLRLLGFTEKKLFYVAWIQIGLYLLVGVIAGVMLGQIVIYNIFKNELATGHVGVYLNNAVGITALLMLLSLTLTPTVKNVVRLKK